VSANRTCWQCGQSFDASLFCPHCKSLQPPPSDYYTLLGLDRKLKLNTADLQQRFYELSRQLHPDRFMRKSEAERQYSLDASSILNDAYRTLKDPVKRAQYVLSQEGFEIGEQRSKDVPPELLEEVFELNMALEEMRSGDDSARPQLESAKDNFSNMLSEADHQLETQFAKYDESKDRETLTKIRGTLNRRKYIQNLLDEVHEQLTTDHQQPATSHGH